MRFYSRRLPADGPRLMSSCAGRRQYVTRFGPLWRVLGESGLTVAYIRAAGRFLCPVREWRKRTRSGSVLLIGA
jgi:hypothetical protein